MNAAGNIFNQENKTDSDICRYWGETSLLAVFSSTMFGIGLVVF